MQTRRVLGCTHENEELTDEVDELVQVARNWSENGDCCHGQLSEGANKRLMKWKKKKKRKSDLRR
jgi:hypothetical protein